MDIMVYRGFKMQLNGLSYCSLDHWKIAYKVLTQEWESYKPWSPFLDRQEDIVAYRGYECNQ